MIRTAFIGNTILLGILIVTLCFDPLPLPKWEKKILIFSLEMDQLSFLIPFIIFNTVLFCKAVAIDKYEKWKEDVIKQFGELNQQS